MKQFENLDNFFDVVPTTNKNPVIFPLLPNEEIKNDDFNVARNTIHRMLEKGEGTLDELIVLAKNSEHPRTYEVAGQFLKTMSDIAKDLMIIQKQMKDIEDKSKSKHINKQTNNVFVGSTEELLKLLKKVENKIIEQ
jgi:hypothetical protein